MVRIPSHQHTESLQCFTSEVRDALGFGQNSVFKLKLPSLMPFSGAEMILGGHLCHLAHVWNTARGAPKWDSLPRTVLAHENSIRKGRMSYANTWLSVIHS